MPRVVGKTVIRGTSTTYNPDAEDELDMDTADRGMRDRSMRGPMHETHETEFDARNTPRMSHPDVAWGLNQSLMAPPPRPGMSQRWIRMGTRDTYGNMDTRNVEAKNRFGWAPRKASSVPEGELFSVLSVNAGTQEDVIRVGNLVLHEIPTERLKAARAQIRAHAKRQEEAVSMETDKASREGMQAGYGHPIVREERVSSTTGRRPPTLAD